MTITTYIWVSFLVTLLLMLFMELIILKHEGLLKRQEMYISLILLNLDLIQDKNYVNDLRRMITKKHPLYGLLKRARGKRNKGGYIKRKLSCYPILFLHDIAETCYDRRIAEEIKTRTSDLFCQYKDQVIKRHIQARENFLGLLSVRGLFLICTMISYSLVQDQVSEKVYIIVETVGNILFLAIIMDVIFLNRRVEYAGNLAFYKWELQIMLLNFDNSVKKAIIESYYIADNEIKRPLKQLIESMNNEGDVTVALRDFRGRYGAEIKNSKTFMPYIKRGYQALCSLGIMINVIQYIALNFESSILS